MSFKIEITGETEAVAGAAGIGRLSFYLVGEITPGARAAEQRAYRALNAILGETLDAITRAEHDHATGMATVELEGAAAESWFRARGKKEGPDNATEG